MAGDDNKKNNSGNRKLSRRAFVVGSGTALAGGAIGAVTAAAAAQQQKVAYPRSTKYLIYDSRGCAGCLACMLSCSLVHEGMTSLSLSRIQVHRAFLRKYPSDLHQNVCRQCPIPLCVDSCPTGACHVSAENGNIRMIDEGKCIGCLTCLNACPQLPHRIIWDSAKKKCTKCDMCVNTPYFNKKGGPGGVQACVEACPGSALRIADELPEQADLRGYDRNLQPPPKPKPEAKPKTDAVPDAKTQAPAAKKPTGGN